MADNAVDTPRQGWASCVHGREVTAMDVYVLGDPHLRIGGRERPFPAGRPGRLLASLLVARGRVVTDDRLVDDVWGEDLPIDARAALHTTVGRARRALGPEGTRIGRTAVGYRLDLTRGRRRRRPLCRRAGAGARPRGRRPAGGVRRGTGAVARTGLGRAGRRRRPGRGTSSGGGARRGPRGARGGAPRAGPRHVRRPTSCASSSPSSRCATGRPCC